ncbi:MAG: MgtC/SapB family protein [Kiritimatiellae bacterium]|nr:MgtC/SapB family protein [Kiritimatiellia bacterium]MDD5521401.1 MgtC/SapB family protein [Kiritimatiellia bacterium]
MDVGCLSIFGIEQCSWDEIVKLLAACFLGGILGMERELTRHPAGLRTHILVSLGSAAVMLMAYYLLRTLNSDVKFDPGRAIQGIITGMGFIGAGAIMKEGYNIHGITTAASLWVASAVGMLAASGAYGIAVFTTLLATAAMAFSPRTIVKHPDNIDSNESKSS